MIYLYHGRDLNQAYRGTFLIPQPLLNPHTTPHHGGDLPMHHLAVLLVRLNDDSPEREHSKDMRKQLLSQHPRNQMGATTRCQGLITGSLLGL